MKRPKLSVIIPVYNEEKTVQEVLDQVWNYELTQVDKELVIVESNSKDGTRAIVEEFAKDKNSTAPGSVKLVLQANAGGKGKAVREGLAHASGEIVLIQDGDLEYEVRDYPSLIEPILKGQTHFVLGSRHLGAGNWKIRNFGKNQIRSRFMNFGGLIFHGLFNLFFGTRLTDPTTMYKVFRRSCLEDFDLVSNRFDFDYELLGKLIRAGYPPTEVPVNYTSRGFEDGKKIRIFRDPLNWVWAILKFRFCPLKNEKARLPEPDPSSSGISDS